MSGAASEPGLNLVYQKKEVNRQCLSLFLCETKVTNVLNLSA